MQQLEADIAVQGMLLGQLLWMLVPKFTPRASKAAAVSHQKQYLLNISCCTR
jgi:hypothetical protein